jgi:serine/threonine protein kinase
MLVTQAGTLLYMAPEVLKGNYDGWAADMFSTGRVLFELFSGVSLVSAKWQSDGDELPIFPEEQLGELRNQIEGNSSVEPLVCPLILGRENETEPAVLFRCLRRDPSSRPSIDDVCCAVLQDV